MRRSYIRRVRDPASFGIIARAMRRYLDRGHLRRSRPPLRACLCFNPWENRFDNHRTYPDKGKRASEPRRDFPAPFRKRGDRSRGNSLALAEKLRSSFHFRTDLLQCRAYQAARRPEHVLRTPSSMRTLQLRPWRDRCHAQSRPVDVSGPAGHPA